MDGRLIGADLGWHEALGRPDVRGDARGACDHADRQVQRRGAARRDRRGGRAPSHGDTVALGVGVPAAVDFDSGEAKSGVNVPLTGVPVRKLLSERLGIPVYVDNDANCAAIAEAHDENGRLVVPDLVMFTVGTGVGGGLVLGGRPYRGATGAAAEMGHQLIGLHLEDDVPEPPAGWPKPGSLEALAAGRALGDIAERIAAEHDDSALGPRAGRRRGGHRRRARAGGQGRRRRGDRRRCGCSAGDWESGSPTH